jgi:hypothetical protein
MSDALDIISDEEISRVHAYANFGGMSPRDVVNDGVRKYAVGYQGGSTQVAILREHGLISKPKNSGYKANLTEKGKLYARAIYHDNTRTDHSQALIAAAYEAAGKYLNALSQAYPDNIKWCVQDDATAVLDLTPADAKAAYDKAIADAERRGMERAAEICTGIIKNYNVMKPDGTTYESLKVQKAAKGMVSLAREDIETAMEDKRGTNKEGYGNEK